MKKSRDCNLQSTTGECLMGLFDHPQMNPEELSPAVWAYIGDAIYELFVRCQLLANGPVKTRQLHQLATAKVRASFQAEMVHRMEPYLTEKEREIVKRGRNVKSGHVPASVDVVTYRYSTAFEALLGFLYLNQAHDRLQEILEMTLRLSEENFNA